MLYCLKHKLANKKCKCDPRDLVSVTDNMIPVLLQAESLELQTASAFCLTETHIINNNTLVQAEVNFRCIYPDVLLQDLPSGWYWTDYITIDSQAICSCLSYESEYVDTGMSLEEFVNGVINDLLGYLETRDKDGLRSILLLSNS